MSNFFRQIQKILSDIPIDFGGGCSVEKAYLMSALITHHDLKTSLDIGVYKGRSFFPQALAHKQFSGGIVYAVDPWTSDEAREYDNVLLYEKINDFIDQTNFDSIYQDVVRQREQLNLQNHSQILRTRSDKAIDFFQENNIYFDLIHIDGNHDTNIVNKDVDLYLKLLSKNGFIVLDDISWDSIKPAYERLLNQMYLIFEKQDKFNDYAVFCQKKSLLNRITNIFVIRLLLWMKK